jgi:uncharacterized protein (TIGR00369 family)
MSMDQNDPPAARLLSREVVELDRVGLKGRLRYIARPEFQNRHGTVQGGFLAAMLDSATAITLISFLEPHETAVTRSLAIDYLRPARVGAFDAHTRVVAREGSKAEVSGDLFDQEGVVVARALAVLVVR